MRNSRRQIAGLSPAQRARFLRLIIFCVAAGAALLALGACRAESPAAHEAGRTRWVTDDLGRSVTIPEHVQRVVSLAPSVTESIFAVGAGDKLIGVTSYCNYPPAAEQIQKIGDTINPNMESIIALRPEIVFVSTASQIENFTRTLEQQNITVFVTNPKNLDDVLKNLEQLGNILGTPVETGQLTADLRRRIAQIEERAAGRQPVRVFVQISEEPLFTIGRESFLTEMIERAGGVSITAGLPKAYDRLSKETALALDPEVIIVSESPDNLEANDVFRNSAAVRSGRVYKINADLLARPAPRLVEALEQIADRLHPKSSP